MSGCEVQTAINQFIRRPLLLFFPTLIGQIITCPFATPGPHPHGTTLSEGASTFFIFILFFYGYGREIIDAFRRSRS